MAESAPKAHRFALAISGAVALGAYEAGALTQFYRDVYAARMAGASLVIDAIAGSSAGSVTGLILAQAIALNSPPDEFEARMRSAWIDGLGILNLLSPPDDSANALFTDSALNRVANRALVPDLGDAPEAGPEETIGLWITMTNLDGIPYCIDFDRPEVAQTAVSFYALSYRDYDPYFVRGRDIRRVTIRTEDLGQAGGGDWWQRCRPASWADARESAMTSAAFPLAFRSRQMKRDLTLYPQYQEFKRENDPALPDTAWFQCVDGGILNNQPIGKAIDAVSFLNRVDPGRAGDERTYLVIEPDPNTAQMVASVLRQKEGDGAHGLAPGSVLAKLIAAYFNDALYSDFAQAADTNRKLKAVDEALTQAAHDCGLEGQRRDQLMAEVKRAIGLDYKRPITLERIPCSVPVKDRLAGDFAGHFGGFLAKELREFDFAVGQREARDWMKVWLAQRAPELGLDSALAFLGEDPADPSEAAPDAPSTGWNDVPAGSRREAVDAGVVRAGQLIARAVPPSKPYLASVNVLLQPKLKSLYADSQPASSPNYRAAVAALENTPLRPALLRFLRGLAALTYGIVLLAGFAGVGLGGIVAAAAGWRAWPCLAAGGAICLLAATAAVKALYTAYLDPYLPIDLPGTVADDV